MLQDEEQRKAYLQLMTSFIMDAPRSTMPEQIPPSETCSKQRVKYMISHPATGNIELSSSGAQLFNSFRLGMTESQVLQLSKHICLELGYVLISDMCKKLYLHLDKNTQVWLELTQENLDTEPIVTTISNLEEKRSWKVYRNNILKVSNK